MQWTEWNTSDAKEKYDSRIPTNSFDLRCEGVTHNK